MALAVHRPAGDVAGMVGLPANTTLLSLGQWLLAQPPDVATSLAIEGGPEVLSTFEAAVELARSAAHVRTYLRAPSRWIRDYVQFPQGKQLVPYQGEALDEMAEHGRLALRGPHGLGKSAIAAFAVLWFSITRDMAGIGWKVPTLASYGRQLTHFLWPEIHLWAGRLRWDLLGRPPFTDRELMMLRLRLAYGEAFAVSVSDPAAAEGAHATHLLYLYDEAKAIVDAAWDATEGAFAGAGGETGNEAWALALSTPGRRSGRFFQIHRRERGFEHWRVRHVRLAEAVAANQVSADWALLMARQWRPNSALFKNRVLGDFADDAANTVILLEWVEAAQARWWDLVDHQVDLGPVETGGLDIARSGEDETVLALSTADTVLELIRPMIDGTTPEWTAQLVSRTRVEASRWPGRPTIAVDSEGIGAGVYDGLASHVDWRDRVLPFRAGSGTTWRDYTGQLSFVNLRSAAWWALRDELDPNRHDHTPTLALPPDPLLTSDLTEPTWREGQGGRILIETKDELRPRLGRSTDAGDAVVMARWARGQGARVLITAASHQPPPGSPLAAVTGDLRQQGDVAGPKGGKWNPGTVGF